MITIKIVTSKGEQRFEFDNFNLEARKKAHKELLDMIGDKDKAVWIETANEVYICGCLDKLFINFVATRLTIEYSTIFELFTHLCCVID